MEQNKIPKDILPTLVIGLGGTGFEVIKRLKELLKKRYGKQKLPVRFLLIDTDLKTFLYDTIENNEKCQLRFGEGIKKTLDWAYRNENFQWLPQNPPITPDFFTSTDQGAGLMRPIGRLYLCKNAKMVYDTLSTAKNDLVDLYKLLTELGDGSLENIDRHKVYVAGSLAGGTGCGTFLDVAVMLSKIFNRDTTNIIGMFTLESCYDDKLSSDLDSQNRSKANCYAALKELEFYMSSITNPEDEKYTFKYSNIGEIKLEKKLFDICYLVENKNEIGGVLTNIEDIYDLCSLQLFQEIGTKLGSQLRADYANFICKDKDPVTQKDRHFSTFSSSSMEFPVDALKKYCSYRLAGEILHGLGAERDQEPGELEEEAGKLMEGINQCLDMERVCMEFGSSFKVPMKITYKEFNSKLGNLNRMDDMVEERRQDWAETKARGTSKAQELLESYVNGKSITHGLKFVRQVLSQVQSEFNREYNESVVESAIDKGKIASSVKSIKRRRVLSGKEPLGKDIVSDFNKYIEQEQKSLKHGIFKERHDLVDSIAREMDDGITKMLAEISNVERRMSGEVSKLDNKNLKKYGGNIITREMVTRDYYEEYYQENIGCNLQDKARSMFGNRSMTDVLKSDGAELEDMCRRKVDGDDMGVTMKDILEREARRKNITLNEHVKNELDIAAKLAKPFWSAVKNPEVSWTECYYIGCVKDENINNGFTIKAPEAVDNWIRNQVGERSRQARYVETTNPYAIDVIHIVMGACADYLPDIKLYKQFYLKLLASRIYPLHLDERYVGLEELDTDAEDMLNQYSLAKAFGVILDMEDSHYLNIRKEGENFKYVYSSPYCLKHQEWWTEKLEPVPENKSMVSKELKLGDSYGEAMKNISGNAGVFEVIREFIQDAEQKFSKEQLKSHCEDYVRDQVKARDFIAKEKLACRVSAH